MISEWLWKKIEFIFTALTVLLMFGVLVFLANVEIKDLDLWLHIGAGRYILNTGTIPHADIFSATIAGHPWINHEWLFQIVVAKLYELGGADALITFRVLIAGLTFFIMSSLGFQNNQKTLVLVMLFIFLFIYPTRFTIRPDMISTLFFILMVYLLGRHLDDNLILPYVFIIQVLWANIHGFFILGPLIILLMIVGEVIKKYIPLPFEWNETGRLNDKEMKRLGVLLGLSVVACLVNPYFIEGLIYPLKVLFTLSSQNKIFFQHIQELEPTVTWASIGNWGSYPEFKVIFIISALSFLLNYRRIDIGLFIFWLIFLVFSVSAVRNIIFFCIAGYIAAIVNLYTVYREGGIPFIFVSKTLERAVKIAIIILIAMLTLRGLDKNILQGYYDFDTDTRKSDYGGISLRNYPEKAVQFLKENEIKGNFFNEFNVGAYMIGQVYPNIRVFIDGRTEVYGAEFFEKYRNIKKSGGPLFEEAADQYNLSGALISLYQGLSSDNLLRYLARSDKWKLVYFDYDAAIFLRDDASNHVFIQKSVIDLNQWQPPEINLHKMQIRPVAPFRFLYRAQALKEMGFPDKAEHQVLQALKASPDYAEAYELLAELYLQEKRYPMAFEAARKAKVLNINSSKINHLLAKSMLYTDDLAGAKKYCDKLLQIGMDNAKVLYLMALIDIKEGNFAQAQTTFQRALNKNIFFVNDMVEVLEAFVLAGRAEVVESLKELINQKIEDPAVIKKVDDLLVFKI